MTTAWRMAAPAKINLWLRVFGRDARGYHAIESLFQLLTLHDTVEARPAPSGVSLAGAPPALGDPAQNLVVQAAQRFLRLTGPRGGVQLRLEKRIPWQAGLGGGSSDAAATLRLLNVMNGRPLDDEDLLTLGAELGSDVPFFLSGAALALGWGRGERLLSLPPLPALPALIVPPAAPVSTAEAYAWIDQSRSAETTGEYAAAVPATTLGSWTQVRRYSSNDFEPAVASRLPAIGHWLDRLRETEPFLVRLCGSGGAVVALYEHERHRDAAWHQLGADESMIRTETATQAPVPEPVDAAAP